MGNRNSGRRPSVDRPMQKITITMPADDVDVIDFLGVLLGRGIESVPRSRLISLCVNAELDLIARTGEFLGVPVVKLFHDVPDEGLLEAQRAYRDLILAGKTFEQIEAEHAEREAVENGR